MSGKLIDVASNLAKERLKKEIGELAGVGRRAAKDKFKKYLEERFGEKAEPVNFMLEMFDVAIDLVLDSKENGGVPGKGDIIRYFANKGAAFGELSSENRIACVKSTIGFISDATKYANMTVTPVGVVAYWALILHNGLDTIENCDLAYLDYKGEQYVVDMKDQLTKQYAQKHAQGVWELKNGQSLDDQMSAIVDNQCRMTDSVVNIVQP